VTARSCRFDSYYPHSTLVTRFIPTIRWKDEMTISSGYHDRSKRKKPISPLRKAVCFNLKKFRELAGWSQRYTAQLLRMAQPSYCAIETGRDDIRLETLEKLAEVFQTDVRAFLAPLPSDEKPKRTRKTA
jgi:DNA-binding XRE family transcriptional regulator